MGKGQPYCVWCNLSGHATSAACYQAYEAKKAKVKLSYDAKVEMLRLADDIEGAEICDLDTAQIQIVTRALRIAAGDKEAAFPS